MKEKTPDHIYCNNWTSLLKLFEKINRNENGARDKYLSIIELAKTKTLTPRQMEGIVDRCLYQIKLIDNPTEKPFSNSERNLLKLSKTQSNGTTQTEK